MTYFSRLQTPLTDGEILKTTLQALGFTVKTDAEVRSHDGERRSAEIVAVLKGDVDLGYSKDADGTFMLIVDLWGVSQNYNVTDLIESIRKKYESLVEINKSKEPG